MKGEFSALSIGGLKFLRLFVHLIDLVLLDNKNESDVFLELQRKSRTG